MRPAFTALAAGSIAAAALLVPSAASADTHAPWPPANPHAAHARVVDPGNDITWTVVDHKIAVLSPGLVGAPIQYTCGTTDAPQIRQYLAGVFQTTVTKATAAAFDLPQEDNTPPRGTDFMCDGTQHTVSILLSLVSGGDGFERGNIEVGLYNAATPKEDPTYEHAIVGDAPEDTRAPVEVTANATPESTKPGKKITVKGTVTRNGHAYKDKYATLYFQTADGQPAKKVGSDHTSSHGNLKTTVKVKGAGTYFWVTKSTSKTQAGASLGDYAAAGTN